MSQAAFDGPFPEVSRWRLLLLVTLLAAATYANSLGNGWAFDDEYIIASNPVVTLPQWREAITGPYWGRVEAAPSLYRPTALLAFASEWQASGGSPVAFHATSLLLHVLVSVLVVLLLAAFLPTMAAAAGGAVFAVHPVHVEAVANAVGQSELLAAAGYLAACLLYLRRDGSTAFRSARLVGIATLYALALGAKEIAVTLPAVLLVLDVATDRREGGEGSALGSMGAAVRREAPLFLFLGAILLGYLGARVSILGSLRGDSIPSELIGLTAGGRVLTALSLWPTYARLLLAPWSLAADYAPGLLWPATTVRADVVLGAALLALALVVAAFAWRTAPSAALAAAWLVVAILPVSNLLVTSGTLVAERTLYLPSVAVAFAVGGVFAHVAGHRSVARRAAWFVTAAVVTVFMVRSALRNPSWLDSYTVMNTLAVEHPESWRSHRSRAEGLVRAGDATAALAEYERSIALVPLDYSLLCEAGSLYLREGRLPRAEALLTSAVGAAPERPLAYRLLAQLYLVSGEARKAHGTALAGLAQWGPDSDLWGLVSESYVAKGDLPAAVRAREAALGADPSSDFDRTRLAELIDAVGATGPGATPAVSGTNR